jgi:hypothetical protein
MSTKTRRSAAEDNPEPSNGKSKAKKKPVIANGTKQAKVSSGKQSKKDAGKDTPQISRDVTPKSKEKKKRNGVAKAPIVEEEDVTPPQEDKVEEKPITEEQKPITEEEKPIVEEEKPITEEEKPITEEEKPITEEEKPIIDEERPIIEKEETPKRKRTPTPPKPIPREESPEKDIPREESPPKVVSSPIIASASDEDILAAVIGGSKVPPKVVSKLASSRSRSPSPIKTPVITNGSPVKTPIITKRSPTPGVPKEWKKRSVSPITISRHSPDTTPQKTKLSPKKIPLGSPEKKSPKIPRQEIPVAIERLPSPREESPEAVERIIEPPKKTRRKKKAKAKKKEPIVEEEEKIPSPIPSPVISPRLSPRKEYISPKTSPKVSPKTSPKLSPKVSVPRVESSPIPVKVPERNVQDTLEEEEIEPIKRNSPIPGDSEEEAPPAPRARPRRPERRYTLPESEEEEVIEEKTPHAHIPDSDDEQDEEEESSEEDVPPTEEEMQDEYIALIKRAKRMYPDLDIEVPSRNLASRRLKKIYHFYVDEISTAEGLEKYKIGMFVGFILIELLLEKLGLPIKGYAELQMQHIASYNSLLIEFGDRNYFGFARNWPVEAKLAGLALFNAAILIVGRLLMEPENLNKIISKLAGKREVNVALPSTANRGSPDPPTAGQPAAGGFEGLGGILNMVMGAMGGGGPPARARSEQTRPTTARRRPTPD